MPDTRREKAALQTLHADNTAGDISAQDNRDGWETCHPAAVVQSGTYASIPASGQVTGDLYLTTDGFGLYRWSGSAWVPFGPLSQFTAPVSGDFAWINQGTATISTTNGGIVLRDDTPTSGFNWRIRKKAAPSTPYTITACFKLGIATGGLGGGGLCFRQSSDGKLHGFEVQFDTTTLYVDSRKLTSPTSFSADYVLTQHNGRFDGNAMIYLRIADNGTNRICSWSYDGVNFFEFHSVSRTDFLTADEVGFHISPNTRASAMTLLSWKEA